MRHRKRTDRQRGGAPAATRIAELTSNTAIQHRRREPRRGLRDSAGALNLRRVPHVQEVHVSEVLFAHEVADGIRTEHPARKLCDPEYVGTAELGARDVDP